METQGHAADKTTGKEIVAVGSTAMASKGMHRMEMSMVDNKVILAKVAVKTGNFAVEHSKDKVTIIKNQVAKIATCTYSLGDFK